MTYRYQRQQLAYYTGTPELLEQIFPPDKWGDRFDVTACFEMDPRIELLKHGDAVFVTSKASQHFVRCRTPVDGRLMTLPIGLLANEQP